MYKQLWNDIKSKKTSIAIIGLGYVGLPLVTELATKFKIIAFDKDDNKINQLKKGIDASGEIESKKLKAKNIIYTTNENDLNKAKFIIVAVPTPIFSNKKPDLQLLKEACKNIGNHLTTGSIVVFESTVYPGVTEEVCLPILEKQSKLKFNKDFGLGYSPERINPGDKKHTLTNVKKIISGSSKGAVSTIKNVYSSIVKPGVYVAESIKVAEAAKVIENCQRDLNVAFVNELAKIFDLEGIETRAVINAAATKWNFLNFEPGLVGGHCIGVDPYYLTHRAKSNGYNPKVILAGRTTNESMGKFIANKTIKMLKANNTNIKNSKVAILGLTFKDNCSDLRNTKVVDINNYLKKQGVKTMLYDPRANKEEINRVFNQNPVNLNQIHDVNAIILAVKHDELKNISFNKYLKMFKDKSNTFIDVKGIFRNNHSITKNFNYWCL